MNKRVNPSSSGHPIHCTASFLVFDTIFGGILFFRSSVRTATMDTKAVRGTERKMKTKLKQYDFPLLRNSPNLTMPTTYQLVISFPVRDQHFLWIHCLIHKVSLILFFSGGVA